MGGKMLTRWETFFASILSGLTSGMSEKNAKKPNKQEVLTAYENPTKSKEIG